jgi:hypothetical protein
MHRFRARLNATRQTTEPAQSLSDTKAAAHERQPSTRSAGDQCGARHDINSPRFLDIIFLSGYGPDMRRKVGTLLEESVLRRAKLESVRQGKQFSELIGEAVESYLDSKGSPRGSGHVVAASWARLPLPAREVRSLVEQEQGLLDA